MIETRRITLVHLDGKIILLHRVRRRFRVLGSSGLRSDEKHSVGPNGASERFLAERCRNDFDRRCSPGFAQHRRLNKN